MALTTSIPLRRIAPKISDPQAPATLSVAGALGSLIFGAILLKGIDEVNAKIDSVSASEKATLLDQMADSVFMPYVVMAIVLFMLGLLMRKAPLPNVEVAMETNSQSKGESQKTIFQYPHLWLGMLTPVSYTHLTLPTILLV